MRAAVYTRVSQDRSAGARSVTQQEQECRHVAEREGWDVVRVFTDNDRSASRYARKPRPGFDQLRAFIATGGCDVLITWEASRSTRDLATYVELRDLCREQGVRWCYSGRTFDLTDDADQFGTGLDALLAEQESARTRTRVQRAVRANAAAGRPHGRNKFGYNRVYDPASGALQRVEIDEDAAAMLRECAGRVLAGESLYAILSDINARGYRTRSGNPWVTSTLRRCLMNPAYAGKRVHRGKVIGDALWPAMYDELTWWRLTSLLTDPTRDTARGKHALAHLLTGIAICGVPGCGTPVRVLNNRGNKTYACSAPGWHLARKKDPVDALVLDVLHAGLRDPALRPAFTTAPVNDGAARHALEAAQLKTARLQGFYDAAASGEITPAALASIETTLLAEVEQHRADARRAELPTELQALGDLDVVTEWERLPLTTQRAIIRHYLSITILPWGKGRRVFDPASVAIEWR